MSSWLIALRSHSSHAILYTFVTIILSWAAKQGFAGEAFPTQTCPKPPKVRFAKRRKSAVVWNTQRFTFKSKAFEELWSLIKAMLCCVLCEHKTKQNKTKQHKTKQNNTTKVVVDKNTTMTYLAYVNQPIKVHGVLSYHNYVSACAQRSQFHRTHLRDSLTIVTPFMRDTNYVSRDFAHRSLSSLYISQLLKLNTAYCKGY